MAKHSKHCHQGWKRAWLTYLHLWGHQVWTFSSLNLFTSFRKWSSWSARLTRCMLETVEYGGVGTGAERKIALREWSKCLDFCLFHFNIKLCTWTESGTGWTQQNQQRVGRWLTGTVLHWRSESLLWTSAQPLTDPGSLVALLRGLAFYFSSPQWRVLTKWTRCNEFPYHMQISNERSWSWGENTLWLTFTFQGKGAKRSALGKIAPGAGIFKISIMRFHGASW